MTDATDGPGFGRLAAVNGPGWRRCAGIWRWARRWRSSGAGVSVPLYPLWTGVINELIERAAARGLVRAGGATCRALAAGSARMRWWSCCAGTWATPVTARRCGKPSASAGTRTVGRTWTPTQELVCRCPFRAVITTNYDPGIVDARIRVRPTARLGTGFTIVDRRAGAGPVAHRRVFGDAELPVLYAHGHHNQPDTIVLATTEYRRAYAGKLGHVLAADGGVGASGVDRVQLRRPADHRDPAGGRRARRHPDRARCGAAARGGDAWNPATGEDPDTLRAPGGDRLRRATGALPRSGQGTTARWRRCWGRCRPRYPPVGDLSRTAAAPARSAAPVEPTSSKLPTDHAPTAPAGSPAGVPARWVPGVEVVSGFVGRGEELARLDRWAADPTVG